MEIVNTLDIDGTQWKVQDVEARNKIATLENNDIAQDLEDIEIKMNNTYTSDKASISQHYKVGKIHFMNIELRNINGPNIGTGFTADIGSINIYSKNETSFLLFDTINVKTLRCYISKDGKISIGESNGVERGNNVCRGELIFAEA